MDIKFDQQYLSFNSWNYEEAAAFSNLPHQTRPSHMNQLLVAYNILNKLYLIPAIIVYVIAFWKFVKNYIEIHRIYSGYSLQARGLCLLSSDQKPYFDSQYIHLGVHISES